MAAPKKYKTNTAKKSSTKSGVSSKTIAKKSTTRVGATKLAKRSFFKPWMALPIIVVVALAGYAIVQFSQASSGYSFFASGGNIRGGQHTRYDTGAGGSQAVTVIKNGQSIYANASKSQLNASSQVCVGFFRPKTGGSADVSISVDGTYSNSYRFVQGNALQPVCSKPLSTGFKKSHKVIVKTIGQASLPVQAIYGKLRFPDPKCGKVIRLEAKWVVANGGRILAEYRRNLVFGCDSRGIHTSDRWSAWKKTGATRPNPNYRNPAEAEAKARAACNARANYLSSYYKTIPGGHGQAKQWRNPYWDGGTCRNKFSSWSQPTLRCDRYYYKKDLKCIRSRTI